MNFKKNVSVEELMFVKSRLCGLTHISLSLRKQIKRSKGDHRSKLMHLKYSFSHQTRHHLIAYGLLRNKPYVTIENKCAEYNKPDADLILRIIHANIRPWFQKDWTIERVKKLLER